MKEIIRKELGNLRNNLSLSNWDYFGPSSLIIPLEELGYKKFFEQAISVSLQHENLNLQDILDRMTTLFDHRPYGMVGKPFVDTKR